MGVRLTRLGGVVVIGLAGCAAPMPPAPIASVSAPRVPPVVVASRRLAPLALRGEVLLALTGVTDAPPGDSAGTELIVQGPGGRLHACITRDRARVRAGTAELVVPGSACAPALRQEAQSAKRPRI